MRVLGLDLGSKRIGLAVSDEEGRIAFPAGTLQRQGREKDLDALCSLAKERGVDRVVVGLPIHMTGRAGPEAKAAERFASELAERSGLPVETLDERWTSLEAERSLREIGRRPSKVRGEIDTVAATILLRTYLERETSARETGA